MVHPSPHRGPSLVHTLGQFGQPPGGLQDVDAAQLLILLGLFLLSVGIFVFSIVVICLNLGAVKRSWRVGMAVGAVLLVIMGASAVASVALMDVEQLLLSRGGTDNVPLWAIYIVIAMVALVALLFKSGWYVLVFSAGVGEWGRAGLPGYALLIGGDRRAWSGIWLGAVFGVFAGAASAAAMIWLEIGMGPMLSDYLSMFSGLEDLPWPVSMLLFFVMVLGPAITEELTFRGLMLGFLIRIFGHGRLAVTLSIVCVSLLWALLHIPNTDMPFTKCLQIFLIGLVLGELARRRGVESAIAGHVMLNLVAVVVGVFWG